MSTHQWGYLSAVVSYVCGGLFPLYLRLLRPSSALEILAHRIVWSSIFLVGIISVGRTWRRLRSLLRPRTLGYLTVASVLIAVNWGTYIYGVSSQRVVETSLGSYMVPLATVLLGVVVLREQLGVGQWVAMALAGVAVVVLTIDYGHIPVVALVIAGTLALYGLVKKRVQLPATDGMALESALLVLPAAGFLVVLAWHNQATFGHVSTLHTVLMVASGGVNAALLLTYVGAANRIPLSAMGLLHYLAPTIQLGCAVLILGEPLPRERLVGFGLVWVALAVFLADGIRRARTASRRADRDLATSPPALPRA